MASSGFMRLFKGTRVLATSSAAAVARPLARPLLRAPRRYEATAVSALSYMRVRFASTTATTTGNTSNTKQAANQVVDAANASGTVGGAPVHHHHHHHHNNNHHHHHNQSNELISLQPGRGKPKKKRQVSDSSICTISRCRSLDISLSRTFGLIALLASLALHDGPS